MHAQQLPINNIRLIEKIFDTYSNPDLETVIRDTIGFMNKIEICAIELKVLLVVLFLKKSFKIN